MIQLKWFRIETGADGALLSCAEVEAKGRSGAVVRYYEAASASKACAAAKDWWANYSQVQRRYQKRMRDKKRDLGECMVSGCHMIADMGSVCKKHHEQVSIRKRLERENGPIRAGNRLGAEEKFTKKKALTNGVRRLPLLRMLKKFDSLGPIEFRAWLVSEINKRSDAKRQIPTEEAQAAE